MFKILLEMSIMYIHTPLKDTPSCDVSKALVIYSQLACYLVAA